MTDIQEINTKVDALGSAWEQFKAANDARLAQIEKKGSADVVTVEQVAKINEALTALQGDVTSVKTAAADLEVKLGRPGAGGDGAKDATAGREYKEAFLSYIRKGNESAFAALEGKALSVGSDPDGGYLVTPAMSDQIIRIVNETTPMRQLATVQAISTDSLDIINDVQDFAAGWTGETGTRNETANAQLGKSNIQTHEMYAQPKATQKLIDDASINIESWIGEKVANIFARNEATAFVSGDGVARPRGILTYAAGTSWGQIEQISSTSGSGGTLSADDFIKLLYGLKEAYAANATFLMNRATVAAARLLKDTTNQYIWQPALAAGQPDSLVGRPVVQGSDMPLYSTSNALAVACGDFRQAYTIVDRIGIRTLRDPFTDKPFVKFYTTKRVGGAVVNFEAIKLLKMDA